jgi:hypothetical protein
MKSDTTECDQAEDNIAYEVSDEALESSGAMASQGRCSAGWGATEWSCPYGAS